MTDKAFMRSLLGDENYHDVESIIEKLVVLERRGAISAEGHQHIITEIADEIVCQQIANDIVMEVERQ